MWLQLWLCKFISTLQVALWPKLTDVCYYFGVLHHTCTDLYLQGKRQSDPSIYANLFFGYAPPPNNTGLPWLLETLEKPGICIDIFLSSLNFILFCHQPFYCKDWSGREMSSFVASQHQIYMAGPYFKMATSIKESSCHPSLSFMASKEGNEMFYNNKCPMLWYYTGSEHRCPKDRWMSLWLTPPPSPPIWASYCLLLKCQCTVMIDVIFQRSDGVSGWEGTRTYTGWTHLPAVSLHQSRCSQVCIYHFHRGRNSVKTSLDLPYHVLYMINYQSL